MLSSRNPRDDEESSDLIELCSSCIAVSFIQLFPRFCPNNYLVMVELGITLMDSCLDLRARVFCFSGNRLQCFKSS